MATLLERFEGVAGSVLDRDGSIDAIKAQLDRLEAERAMLLRFPELHRLDHGLRGRGLNAVLDEVSERGLPPDVSASSCRACVAAIGARPIEVGQPALAQFDGLGQTSAVGQFAGRRGITSLSARSG